MSIVTRFAPSPTGYLHLGHAFSAWNAWSRADSFRLRFEDIDGSRCRPEFASAIIEDLAWLGLEWDGAPLIQSQRIPAYQAALNELQDRGLLYPCFCSRAEIARALSAPHGKDPGYPGTCRHLSISARAARLGSGKAFALRLDVAKAMVQTERRRFFDEIEGWSVASPATFGDVILARKDTPTSYHLCVVHDDAAMDITHVIRGEDLREATHIHVLLQSLLGLPTPAYAHHRLLRDENGIRLAKREGAVTLRAMRRAGATPNDILRGFDETSGI